MSHKPQKILELLQLARRRSFSRAGNKVSLDFAIRTVREQVAFELKTAKNSGTLTLQQQKRAEEAESWCDSLLELFGKDASIDHVVFLFEDFFLNEDSFARLLDRLHRLSRVGPCGELESKGVPSSNPSRNEEIMAGLMKEYSSIYLFRLFRMLVHEKPIFITTNSLGKVESSNCQIYIEATLLETLRREELIDSIALMQPLGHWRLTERGMTIAKQFLMLRPDPQSFSDVPQQDTESAQKETVQLTLRRDSAEFFASLVSDLQIATMLSSTLSEKDLPDFQRKLAVIQQQLDKCLERTDSQRSN